MSPTAQFSYPRCSIVWQVISLPICKHGTCLLRLSCQICIIVMELGITFSRRILPPQHGGAKFIKSAMLSVKPAVSTFVAKSLKIFYAMGREEKIREVWTNFIFPKTFRIVLKYVKQNIKYLSHVLLHLCSSFLN